MIRFASRRRALGARFLPTATLAVVMLALSTMVAACRPAERDRVDPTPEPTGTTVPKDFAPLAALASPATYSVLHETSDVRLLLASWSPGESDRLHGHPTVIWYALTAATLAVERPGHSPLPRSIAAGDSGVQQTIAAHTVTNLGDEEARLLMFELLEPEQEAAVIPTGGQAPPAIFVANEFQLLEEHHGYRLVEATLAPSEETALHSHRNGLWFALSDANLRLRQVSGPDQDLELSAGEASSRPAVRAHTVENTGSSAARFLVLERP